MQRSTIRERSAPGRSLAHVVLALVVALLGVQIGDRSWRASRAEIGATRSSSLTPRQARGRLFLPAIEPIAPRDTRTTVAPTDPPSRSQSPSPTPPEFGPGAPFPLSSEASAPALGGFVAPRGPDYGGRPLPLPSVEQLRFLARKGLLDPTSRFTGLQQPDPLKIALGPSLPQPERIAGPSLPVAVPPRIPLAARSGVQIGPMAPGESASLSPTRTLPPGLVAEQRHVPPSATPPALGSAVTTAASAPTSPSDRVSPSGTAAATPLPGTPPPTQTPETDTSAPERKNPAIAAAAGETAKADNASATATPAEPLRLQMTVDARPGTGRTAGPMALVRITASAACHLALYRIAPSGRITPLLTLAGSGRMRPADSYSLAAKVDPGARDRLVALGSRTPLSAREAQLCLGAFLAEQGGGEPTPADGGVSLAVALRALADDTGRRATAGPSDPPDRTAWAIATAPLRLPSLKPSGGTKDSPSPPGRGS